jgi:hypothetical protein
MDTARIFSVERGPRKRSFEFTLRHCLQHLQAIAENDSHAVQKPFNILASGVHNLAHGANGLPHMTLDVRTYQTNLTGEPTIYSSQILNRERT